ncbi:alpha-N-acetylglucosaminidase [Niastella populi]|nr:alpha-N-acetylglucosaminidase [Niastella populi]
MLKRMKIAGRHSFMLLIMATMLPFTIAAQLNTQASKALIQRVLPKHATRFIVEAIAAENGKDIFEVESRAGKIVLRGNNGLSVASALYHYLTEYAHCQITWNGTNLNLPASLPVVKEKVRRATPYTYRYYLNYCTFNYSMSWWDWDRWQKEIDWMALHGINMPLAITGEEYTWYVVYKDMGFSDAELKDFFSGPAYFGWFWMGNLDAWGGPLPLSWMKSHKVLQEKILKRERELGMKPVLPAFTGHVPPAFKKKYPNARLKATNWTNGFADTYILDSEDPLFAEIGKKFLQKQTQLFGTDHLYSADTFNENEPPSDDPAFLGALSARVYEGMKQADTAATWVMQGWLFYSDRKFWKAPQIEALLKAVPGDKMLLLDLAAEIEPVWKRTNAFYDKPWIWNMLHNFGGNVNMFGRMDGVAAGPAAALNDKSSGKMWGIGLTMEAIEQNPVLYELMMEHAWQTEPIILDTWLPKYVLNRYATNSNDLVNAWQILRQTVYNGKDIRDGAESIVTGRPTFDSTTVWTRTKLNYDRKDLLPAWDLFIQAAGKGINTDGFRYDVVDITRQVLANYAGPLQKKWVTAYKEKDSAAFNKYSKAFLQLISDMDVLLATRKDFMLGPWIASARSHGTTPAEKALYEQNARDLITLWGDANSPLHEYSNRQWSGLLNDFYKPRWQQFFALLQQSLRTGKEPDLQQFGDDIKQWEWKWVTTQKGFPVVPIGDAVKISVKMYNKYRKELE